MQIRDVEIVVVGAGPSGIGAAIRLNRAGYKDILLLDRFSQVGGIPHKYKSDGVPTFVKWSKGKIVHGCEYAKTLSDRLQKLSIETSLSTTVLKFSGFNRTLLAISPQLGQFKIQAKVVILACGAREQNRMERGWIVGERPARVYNSFHMLDLIHHLNEKTRSKFYLTGSETITYSMAAKLSRSKKTSSLPKLVDNQLSRKSSIFSKLYFRKWANPHRIAPIHEMSIKGFNGVESLIVTGNQTQYIPADYLVMTGKLIPNTELLVDDGSAINPHSRQITPGTEVALNQKGIFLAGNMKGTSSSGEIAYFNGYFSARKALQYLK